MARKCTVCSLPREQRVAVERESVEGRPFSAIGRTYGVGRDSVRHHLQTHVAPAVRNAITTVDEATAVALGERMARVADAARDARLRLAAEGRDMDAIRAGEAEIRALSTLAERLGINSLVEVQQARKIEDFARALPEAARADPSIIGPIVAALENQGATGAARALASLAPSTTTSTTETNE